MQVVDLSSEHEGLFCDCLEDWSDEMKDAGDHKARWCAKMKDRGLRVKLATDDAGTVGGMIQYVPVEHSLAEGRDLYFVLCIWVHGYKHGRGDFQKRGMGKALLAAAEQDVQQLGGKGLVAWGLWLPFWMKASWFRKQGYKKVDRSGVAVLVWKPFAPDAVPPRWVKRQKKPQKTPGRVTVTGFVNGWCPGQNIAFERARRAAESFDQRVVFHRIDTSDRDVFLEWGIGDAVFVDDKQVGGGPPPPLGKFKKEIARRLKKL